MWFFGMDGRRGTTHAGPGLVYFAVVTRPSDEKRNRFVVGAQ